MGGKDGHVHPADLVRVLTFACVIGVHTVSTVNSIDSVPGGAVVMLLHFTREAFFVLTGFVLTHRYRAAAPSVLPFWRRRFLLIGVPYVLWSVIYTGLQVAQGSIVGAPVAPGDVPRLLLTGLLTGTAWFHLYFLLVSMQFYLLFPLFRRLLRATRGHHGLLLAASAALQVGTDLWLHDAAPDPAKVPVLLYAGSFVLSYQFFLVLGGVVALHLDDVDAWVRRHPVVVVAALVGTGAAAEGWYWWSVAGGATAEFAADVFQPVMVLWAVAVVAAFWALGAVWSDRRAGGFASRCVEGASDRSFGVFLVHPAILWALTAGGDASPAAALPAPWSSVAAYVVAVLGSLLVVELLRHTPLRLALTGKSRPRAGPGRARPAPPATVGATRTEEAEMKGILR